MATMNWKAQTAENLGVDNTPIGGVKIIESSNEPSFLSGFKDSDFDYSKVFGEVTLFQKEDFKKAYGALSESAYDAGIKGLKEVGNKTETWLNKTVDYIGSLFTSARDTVSATATQVSDYIKYSPQNETSILSDTKSNLLNMGKKALNVTTETVKDIAGKAQEKAKEKLKSVAIYGVIGAVLVLAVIIKRKKK